MSEKKRSPQENRPYISTAEAAERSNLSQSYIADLTRHDVIEGFQPLHEWFVYVDSLNEFLAKPRKPGPKGPRTSNNPRKTKK